ncbi:MAG: class I SAM-dependent methyltransferase [Candidatus Caldarchaeum sp.]
MAVLDYDVLSDCYDELYGEEQLRKYREALYIFEPLQCSRVLDVGCGTGLLIRFLRENGVLCEYVGVDISSRMLEKASGRADSMTHLIMADAHHLPFRDNVFDVLSSFTVIHHLNVSGFLAEASRVCGNILVVTQHKRLSPRIEHNIRESNTADEIVVITRPAVLRQAAGSSG